MKRSRRTINSLRTISVLLITFTSLFPLGVLADTHQGYLPSVDPMEIAQFGPYDTTNVEPTGITAPQVISPTLEMDILGTPYAPYDFNTVVSPEVFMVHARVVNTGTVTATNVTLTLDFDDGPGSDWALLDGEVDERSIDALASGNTLNAYWFAVYPLQAGETHTYTVTAAADSFNSILEVGTVEVVEALDTSNIFLISRETDTDAGGDITLTLTYDLGTNPVGLSFSPVGNTDFLPGNYQLHSSEIDFLDEFQVLVDSFTDKVYFPIVDPLYDTATITYKFRALSPTNVRMCSYNLVETVPFKYDKKYCSGDSLVQVSTITGNVFHDENGNGLIDTLEVGIEGVTLTLDGVYTTTTDINGAYTFSTIISGTHTVVETDLAGYFSTTPNEVHPTVTAGDEIQVDFGDALSSVDEFASIHGTVFHDLNLDGIWDADESGIPGVMVTLDGTAAATTNLFGSYTFSTTLTGTHTVVETDPVKYISTTPNTVDVYNVLLGQHYLVNFGDIYMEHGIYLPIICR